MAKGKGGGWEHRWFTKCGRSATLDKCGTYRLIVSLTLSSGQTFLRIPKSPYTDPQVSPRPFQLGSLWGGQD